MILKKIEIGNSLLIVNDTLVLFENDTTSDPKGWISATLTAENWGEKKKMTLSELQELKSLVELTNNYRIIREQKVYFFSEGGWIDSNFGVVYSKTDPRDKIDEFRFDRVQEIDPITGKKYWYEYYAD